MDLETKALKDLPIEQGLHNTTCALFFEWKDKSTCPITPPYTLKLQDHELHGIKYKSMYLIYMSCASEYEAAIRLLGHYGHWKKLSKARWFAPILEEWRDDMAKRDEAMALRILKEEANGGNVTAAKAILAEAKGKKPVGRPKNGGKPKRETTDSDLEEFLNHAEKQER